MKQRELLTQVVDLIEAQQDAVAELRKEAAEAKNKPAFSDEVLDQTAEKLVSSELLSKEASDNLVQSFREDPEQALRSLQKLAAEFGKRNSAPEPLGKPARIKKSAAAIADNGNARPESDKAWEASFGSGA